MNFLIETIYAHIIISIEIIISNKSKQMHMMFVNQKTFVVFCRLIKVWCNIIKYLNENFNEILEKI